jgi:flagellar hook-basal body complex protein FliE
VRERYRLKTEKTAIFKHFRKVARLLLCEKYGAAAPCTKWGLDQAMSTIDQSRLLQMRSAILTQNTALQRAAGRGVEGVAPGAPTGQGGEFGKTMVDALKAVDAQQGVASDLSAAYERGDTHDIVKVMVERQKASLGFEATLQVRNKLLSAYRDIMNMPV